MLEREMEDLIAAQPDYLFPRHGLVLQGRQRSLQGIGRFDLLFKDRHGMNILMELKAGPARYEVIDQVARYRDALVDRGLKVLMWIVAPQIPPGLREFLSHLGIEYSEITQSEFSRAAQLFGYSVSAAIESVNSRSTPLISLPEQQDGEKGTLIFSTKQNDRDEWGFGLGTQPSYLFRSLETGEKTREQIRSEYITHFHPELSYAEAKNRSSFSVFFSDSKRPLGTYHASRSLILLEDHRGVLSLEPERMAAVKSAIRAGILERLRGLHFKRNKKEFDAVLSQFGLPTEP